MRPEARRVVSFISQGERDGDGGGHGRGGLARDCGGGGGAWYSGAAGWMEESEAVVVRVLDDDRVGRLATSDGGQVRVRAACLVHGAASEEIRWSGRRVWPREGRQLRRADVAGGERAGRGGGNACSDGGCLAGASTRDACRVQGTAGKKGRGG